MSRQGGCFSLLHQLKIHASISSNIYCISFRFPFRWLQPRAHKTCSNGVEIVPHCHQIVPISSDTCRGKVLRILEGQLSLTQVSLFQWIIIPPLAMQIVLAVPKMSLWVPRRCQLLTWWEIEFSLGKGEDHFFLWLQNNKGWKEKGRNIPPVM